MTGFLPTWFCGLSYINERERVVSRQVAAVILLGQASFLPSCFRLGQVSEYETIVPRQVIAVILLGQATFPPGSVGLASRTQTGYSGHPA